MFGVVSIGPEESREAEDELLSDMDASDCQFAYLVLRSPLRSKA